MIDHTSSNNINTQFNNYPYVPNQNQAPTNEAPTVNKPIILVVDDSPIVGNTFKHALQNNEKYTVEVATNGLEAVKFIQSKGPNDIPLLFLDLNMPGTNGFNVLEYMRENNLFNNINVNIVSGNLDDQADINRACAYPVKNLYDKATLSIGKIQEIVASYDQVRK